MLIPWLLVYSFYFIFKDRLYFSIFKEVFTPKGLIAMFDSFLVVFLVSLLYSMFSQVTAILLVAIAFVFSFLIFKIKNKKLFYIITAMIYLLVAMFLILKIKSIIISVYAVGEIFGFIILFSILKQIYLIIKTKVLIESKTIGKLKEGDLLIYNYYYKNKKLKLIKPTFFTKIKMLASNCYYKDLKVDSSKSCGITEKDILFLKTMYKNNLIKNKIYFKKTLAFVPAVLLAYILMIIV